MPNAACECNTQVPVETGLLKAVAANRRGNRPEIARDPVNRASTVADWRGLRSWPIANLPIKRQLGLESAKENPIG